MNLIWVQFKRFALEKDGKIYWLSDLKAAVYALKNNGISMEEIERGINSMAESGGNYVNFGIRGTFILSGYDQRYSQMVISG